MAINARLLHLILALGVAYPWGAVGSNLDTAHPADPALSELAGALDDLGDQTRIATRTKLNVDYAPGTVNVLHGGELLDQGARTVWEAMEFIPGFEPVIDETGMRQLLVRGVGRTYASGNVKILLNDIAQNSELTSLANPILNMPLEQIERIEVIRGPGSAVYGQSAYMGVVNVITRRDGQRVYASLGSSGSAGGGGTLSFSAPEKELYGSLNLAAWKTDGPGVRTGTDGLYDPSVDLGAFSYAPGQANDTANFKSALFNLDYRRFSLVGQWVEDGTGDHFGINYYLPPPGKHIVTRLRHRSLEADQKLDLAPNLQAELKLGWMDFEQTKNQLFVGPGAIFPAPADVFMDLFYREKRVYVGADLAWELNRHTLLVGWTSNRIEVAGAGWSWNAPFALSPNWTDVNKGRSITSITLQDEFRPTSTLTLTAGLRYDGYNDVGSSTTPRLAAVWQVAPRHILKAQYAEAFRAPTFNELFNGGLPAPTIRPETIATREIGYAYKGQQTQGRITLFDSQLKNLIIFDNTLGYMNADQAKSQGMEVEAEQWFGSAFKLSGNLTILQTHDDATGQPIPGAGNRLAGFTAGWHPNRNTALELRLRHVGEGDRETGDLRPPLNGYQRLDVTGRFANFTAPGLTLRLGVKNLLDRDIHYPAPLATYASDYPSAGRQWWTQVAYAF